jgi:hypothetical protein
LNSSVNDNSIERVVDGRVVGSNIRHGKMVVNFCILVNTVFRKIAAEFSEK